MLQCSYISAIWQAHRQHSCRDIYDITNRSYNCKTISQDISRFHESWDPFYLNAITLSPAWISNHMPSMNTYNGCNYLSMLRIKLNHVSKKGPCYGSALSLSEQTPRISSSLVPEKPVCHWGDVAVLNWMPTIIPSRLANDLSSQRYLFAPRYLCIRNNMLLFYKWLLIILQRKKS